MWSFMQSYAALLQQNMGDPRMLPVGLFTRPRSFMKHGSMQILIQEEIFYRTMIGPGYTRSGQKINN
jgi:hypothetical protein